MFNIGACPESGLGREVGWLQRRLLTSRTLLRLLGVRVSTAANSGADLARLVTDTVLDGVTGRYFDRPGEARSSGDSYDLAKAQALWEESAFETGRRRTPLLTDLSDARASVLGESRVSRSRQPSTVCAITARIPIGG